MRRTPPSVYYIVGAPLFFSLKTLPCALCSPDAQSTKGLFPAAPHFGSPSKAPKLRTKQRSEAPPLLSTCSLLVLIRHIKK